MNKTSLRYIIFASLALVSGLQAIEKRTPAEQLEKLQAEERQHNKEGRPYPNLNDRKNGHKRLVLKTAQKNKLADIKESDIPNNKALSDALALSEEYTYQEDLMTKQCSFDDLEIDKSGKWHNSAKRPDLKSPVELLLCNSLYEYQRITMNKIEKELKSNNQVVTNLLRLVTDLLRFLLPF